MADEIQSALRSRWAEYQKLREASATYSALVRLGEIENVLRHSELEPSVFQDWRRRLHGVALSEDVISAALAEARDKASRLMQVVSVGTSFTYEELLYAITMRIELQLLSEFLHGRGVEEHLGLGPLPCDSHLRNIAVSRANASSFLSAQSAARRNWGIPITSQWLRDQARPQGSYS